MGKLGYMAPEQARGEAVDHRADQYALSIVAWELLSNQSWVRRGTLTEMVVAMAHPTIRPLAPLRTDVPPSLEAVVLKALSPLPEGRYGSTDEFAQALMGELLALGPPPNKPQLGQYVKSRCAADFATTRQLLTRVSTQRSPPPMEERPKAEMFSETVVKAPPPVLTAPSRPASAPQAATIAVPGAPGISSSELTVAAPITTIAGGSGAAALDGAAPPTAAPVTTIAGGPASLSGPAPSAALDVTAAPAPAPVTTVPGGSGAVTGAAVVAPTPVATVPEGVGAVGAAGGVVTGSALNAAELSAALDVTAMPQGAASIRGAENVTAPPASSGNVTTPPASSGETSPARPAVMPASVDPLPTLTPAERPLARVDVQAVPTRAQLPLSTGEMAIVNPRRGPRALVITGVAVLLVAVALVYALHEPDPVAGVETVIDAGASSAPKTAQVPVVQAFPAALPDAGEATIDAGAQAAVAPPVDEPPPPAPNLQASGRLGGAVWYVRNRRRRRGRRRRVLALRRAPDRRARRHPSLVLRALHHAHRRARAGPERAGARARERTDHETETRPLRAAPAEQR
jgi:hypothetical protein